MQKNPTWIQEAIKLGNPYAHIHKNPYLHNFINLSYLLLIVTAMLAVQYLGSILSAPLYVLAGSLLLGFLYYASIVLGVHESSHNMFILSKNRDRALFWNRFFGNLLCVPLMVNYGEHWERGHILHHQRPGEKNDPQACHPRTGRELLIHLAKFLLIPGYLFKSFRSGAGDEFSCNPGKTQKHFWWRLSAFILFWTLIIVFWWLVFGVTGIWPRVLAVFLGINITASLNSVKAALEHGGIKQKEANPLLRQFTYRFFLRHIFGPFNLSYHFEHHLNYTIPWYSLPKYYREVRKLVPKEVQPYIYNDHFIRQLRGLEPLSA